MKTKSLTIEKMDDAGTGIARIAQLSAVDNDGDTYAPGAFSWPQGGFQWGQMLPAHDRRAMPLGKCKVYEEGDFAYAALNLNLATQAGKDWHETLKFDLATGLPVQEWSYGFEVLDAEYEQRDGQRVQVLKKLRVLEVSPVLQGAGVGTGTLSIKSAQLKSEEFSRLMSQLNELAEAVTANPGMMSATARKQLADMSVVLIKAAEAGMDVPTDQTVAGRLVGDLAAFQSRHNLRPQT